jgi:hypothetical protein
MGICHSQMLPTKGMWVGTSFIGNPNPMDARLLHSGMTTRDPETQSNLGAPFLRPFDKAQGSGQARRDELPFLYKSATGKSQLSKVNFNRITAR